MKDEKDLYDVLSSKFEDKEVPFNIEHWRSMRTMIDSSRAANRRTVWLIVSLGLLLLGGTTTAIIYKWNNETGKTNTISALSLVNKSNNKTTINSNKNPSPVSLVEAPGSKIASNKGHLNLNINKPVIEKQSSANKPVSQLVLASNFPLHNSHSTINNVSIAKQLSQPIASNNVGSSGSVQQNNMAQISQPNNTVQGSQQNNMTPVTQQSNIVQSARQNEVVQSAQPNNAVQSSLQNNRVSNKSAAGNQVVISHKPIMASNSSALHKTDSMTTGASLPQRFSDEPRIYKGKTNIFSVEFGTEYVGGWQIGSVVQGKGFNPIVGVGYSHYMGHKLFLKASLQLNTFGNMNTLPYTYQHTIGNVSYDSAIATKRLYFLRIPVQLEYAVGHNKRSSIGLGCSAWVLLGNSGSASTYQQIDNSPADNVVAYSQNAPLNGYTRIDISGFGLYKYTLSHHFSIYGILYIEGTSIKENSFFGGNVTERTNGVQALISYSLN